MQVAFSMQTPILDFLMWKSNHYLTGYLIYVCWAWHDILMNITQNIFLNIHAFVLTGKDQAWQLDIYLWAWFPIIFSLWLADKNMWFTILLCMILWLWACRVKLQIILFLPLDNIGEGKPVITRPDQPRSYLLTDGSLVYAREDCVS